MGLGNFQASCQYIARWKKRYDVPMRVETNESQKLPADYAEAIEVFRKAVSTLRRKHDYTDYNIANMDRTMVRMDCPATRKNNATYGFVYNGSGKWIHRVWGPNVDDVRRLLVLDQAPIPKTEAAREAFYARGTDTRRLHINTATLPTRKLAPKENLKRPSRQNIVDFVAEDTVRRSFQRCGISTRINGMEDGELNDRLASVDDAAEAGSGEHESQVDEALDIDL
ncbi:hypothetical protein HPB47_027993 [Ixodes persulcatus]|uniref:Uncharacterized protein n=1 Tax=Ixodes persulcatus TaxID=34615 RepID=A0AC60PVJ7_IXOPE|nr:hypothetical protein HPB47_027993 [Ixodes persulcatus]